MATIRPILAEALRALGAVGLGDDAAVDELNAGVEAVQALVWEIHEARGPLLDVDVTTPTYIASEDQRLRIQAGDVAALTLPNSIPIFGAYNPSDYGFNGSLMAPPVGSTAPANGVTLRQPRDGARIEIVGTAQALYFYRADINQWIIATGLTLDSETPLNNRYSSNLAALLAERLAPLYPIAQINPLLLARLNRARQALFIRPGVQRDPMRAEYL